MKEILNLLPVLLVAIFMNIEVGIYRSIEIKNLCFSWKTLITGIVKAGIISSIFIGTAYCFEATDLSSIGVTPVFLITSAITLYVGKTIISLGEILGIEIHTK